MDGPLFQLVLGRLKMFIREPAALFWVYGFPLLMSICLGLAFRNRPIERLTVDIPASPGNEQIAKELQEKLGEDKRITVHTPPRDLRIKVPLNDPESWKNRLRSGKTDLVIIPSLALRIGAVRGMGRAKPA